jgi:hypothetical protein
MQFRLPYADSDIPCFKLRDTEVYLVVNKILCSFTGFEVRPLKTLTEDIKSWRGASYYRRGTLYCSSDAGAVRSFEIREFKFLVVTEQLGGILSMRVAQAGQSSLVWACMCANRSSVR